tara:strand:+ start:226 stop:552 length:327 start_codon:yes stop_codon:yes gene_type:complete
MQEGLRALSEQIKDLGDIRANFDHRVYAATNQGVLGGKTYITGKDFSSGRDYIKNAKFYPQHPLGPFGGMSRETYVNKFKSGNVRDLPFDSPQAKDSFLRLTGRRVSI